MYHHRRGFQRTTHHLLPFYRHLQRWIIAFAVLSNLLPSVASAQMNGTYTIGPEGIYPTIESAIGALNNSASPQVTGPVTFLIKGGNYTPPAGRYLLGVYSGMSSINRVTFRPDTGATVTISGSISTTIFDLNGGDFFVIDGSNRPGSSSRDWKIINSHTSGSVVRFINGATNNIVRNMVMIGSGSSSTYGVVKFDGTNNGIANADNLIADNLIGDPDGGLRSNAGISMTGSAAAPNIRNTIAENEIINFGYGTSIGYGISISSNNQFVKILHNHIHCTAVKGTDGLYPMYGVYYNNPNTLLDTLRGNRIHDLNTLNPTAAQYGVYILAQGNSPIVIRDNMISLVADQGTLAGVYYNRPDSLYCDYNTIRIGGMASTSTTSYTIYNGGASKLWLRNNILVNKRVATGNGTNRLIHFATLPTTVTSDHNLLVASGASTAVGYRSSVALPTLSLWQKTTGLDIGSLTGGFTFANEAAGDLHIDPDQIFVGESKGIAIAGIAEEFDIDGDRRDGVHPDIGADEGAFNIGSVQLEAPNGGEMLITGEVDTIRWMSMGGRNIRLEYSIDAGITWQDVTGTPTPIPAFLAAYPWRIPEGITNHALFRVFNNDKPQFADTSDREFSIGRAEIKLLAPSGSVSYQINSEVRVTWSRTNVRAINLDYSSDGGVRWERLATGISSNLTGYSFTPPAIPTPLAMVRLVDTDRPWVEARSATPFRILPARTISVDAPAWGDRLLRGSTVEILWNASGIEKVNVLVTTDGGRLWTSVALNVPASQGAVHWNLPNILSTSARVWVQESGGTIFGESSLFAIVDTTIRPPVVKGRLTVLAPNGGESYPSDTTVTLVWSAENIPSGNLLLDYSLDGGVHWAPIATVPTPTRSYRWRVPHDTTHQGLFRVRAAAAAGIVDISDAPWEIRSIPIIPPEPLVVVSPNGGEGWSAGEEEEILWTSPGDILSVAIDFSTDGGASWATIASGVESFGGGRVNSYRWMVPSRTKATASALVRVRDEVDTGRNDISNGAFSISPVLVGGVEGAQGISSLPLTVTNHPNPFLQWTEITWRQPQSGPTLLRIYRPDGELQEMHDLGYVPSGEGRFLYNGRSLSSGLYFYEIRSEEFVGWGRMIVTR